MRSVLIIWNSRPHKSFELGLGELDRLVYRFALLRALGDHFADGALREHLRAEACWRHERGRRLVAAAEAFAAGYGGIAAVAMHGRRNPAQSPVGSLNHIGRHDAYSLRSPA